MKKLTILFGLVMALALALPGGAHAATFTVNSTTDVSDANPGDGVCDDGAGNCTLRAAIEEANALVGADTITLPAGSYILTGGELLISDDLTISGAGQATTFVDGGLVARVFRIFGSTVDISGVTIQNGIVGGLQPGGGIFNAGTMTLTNVTVSSNSTATDGGGIVSFGTMELTNVIVTDNTALGSGGGILNGVGTITLTNVTVSDNSAIVANGGGILNGGAMELTDVTVSSNTAAGSSGGGIVNGGTMELTNVIVSDNSANRFGGGIFNFNSTMTLTNVTVSGNSAGADGGGIANGFFGVRGTMTLSNVTVSDNTALASGGGIVNNRDAVLNNSIIGNNTPDNCVGTRAIISGGHNLEDANSCGFTAPGDLTNTDPLLGPLQDNGGTTETHALLPGSPAIDAGSGDCPPPTTDQRGVTRPQGADCDIGAYEFEPPVGGLVVDLDGGPLSAAQPSGGSAGRLAGTIAGIAAFAVMLTGAAWYARRRGEIAPGAK